MTSLTSHALSLLLGIGLLLTPSVAQAQVTSIDDNDQKLYLNQSPPAEVWGVRLDNTRSAFYQSGGFFVSKGKVRLMADEFFEHLERAKVGESLVAQGRREMAYQNVLTGCGAGFSVLALLSSNLLLQESLSSTLRPGSSSVNPVLLGLTLVSAAGALTTAGFALFAPPKLPSADETVSVLRQYNDRQPKAK